MPTRIDSRLRMPKQYNRAYFDKWYRSPQHRVGSRAQLARKVAMAVHLAEYYLARPLHNVLDIGCGEAPWRAELRRLRPVIEYRGLDASEYVVARHGRRRSRNSPRPARYQPTAADAGGPRAAKPPNNRWKQTG